MPRTLRPAQLVPRLVAPAVLAALLGAVLGACKEEAASAPAAQPGRPVLVQRVSVEDGAREHRLVGTIRPRVESDLGFRVQGKVSKRLVNVGDAVVAQQALATLDEVDFGLQTEQAEAEQAAAVAGLAQADADLKRTLTLAAQGWTPTSTVDRQRAATEEARSRALRAERALRLARNAGSYAVLRADADGVVMAALVEPGQVVAPGQAAIRVAHTAEKEAVVAVPEALVAAIRGNAAYLSLWSAPGSRYRAALRELAPAADAMTRTYLARFALPDADGAVQLGMTATVTVAGPSGARVARVPLSALLDQGGGPAVWVVDEAGGLSLRPVRVTAYDAEGALVGEGLSGQGLADGERVVRLGAQKLDPGQRVRVVDALQF